jgi:hypothetical protein
MSEQNLIVPDFIDTDAAAISAAEAGLLARSGGGWSIPAGVKIGAPTGKKNQKHARWSEEGTIAAAYRTVTSKGLLDVVIQIQSRVGQPNEGASNFFHAYINNAVLAGTATEEQMQKHGRMTDDSMGLISTLLKATGMFPTSGGFKASLLGMLFPAKGQPGAAPSPLTGKTVIVNCHASVEKKFVTTPADEEKGTEATTEEIEDTRIQADSFLVSK